MDYIWISVAFICGFLVKQINLPPLIGYLAAGFGLHALGYESDKTLEALADLGVTLLLFTIGLKLNIKSLFKTEIWASTTAHMTVTILITVINCLFLASLGFAYFGNLDLQSALLIGFAVSFSSTVCAVKVLEDKGEMKARHGQIAIGILVIQDIAAVLFVTLATDVTPSWWAFTLLLLPLTKPLLFMLLERSGHSEILPLTGFFLAISGAELFELFHVKAHLGAIVMGILLSEHIKSVELAKSLLNFKDIFLIGFFLSIGFTALPTMEMIGVAVIILVALPFKTALLFWILSIFKLRSRSAFLTSMSLSNYSEFGLIVCSFSVSYGLLDKEWLVIIALAVALSFFFSSIANIKAHSMYARWIKRLKFFEKSERLPEDDFSQFHEAKVLIIGMGRVGRGAYQTFEEKLNHNVCGVDVDSDRVSKLSARGHNIALADAEDPDFWSHLKLDKIQLVMLAVPNFKDIIEINKQLKLAGYSGNTAGIARYRDEEKQLEAAGINMVFNFYRRAGSGFANQCIHLFEEH